MPHAKKTKPDTLQRQMCWKTGRRISDRKQNIRISSAGKTEINLCGRSGGFIGDDGRIHGKFNQTVTATGRLSSTEPNLQNIPVRMELGRMIRKVFVPKEDCVLSMPIIRR